MKTYFFRFVVVIGAIILLSGCTLPWPIRMEHGDFSKIEDTKVKSLVLKNGMTITFGKDGGQYVKKIIKDTLYIGIVGYDTSDTTFINFPMHDIVSVEGRRGEVSIALSILVGVLSVVLVFIGLLFFVFPIGAH